MEDTQSTWEINGIENSRTHNQQDDLLKGNKTPADPEDNDTPRLTPNMTDHLPESEITNWTRSNSVYFVIESMVNTNNNDETPEESISPSTSINPSFSDSIFSDYDDELAEPMLDATDDVQEQINKQPDDLAKEHETSNPEALTVDTPQSDIF